MMMTENREDRIQDLKEQIELVTHNVERARAQVKHLSHRFNVLTEILSDLILEEDDDS